MRQIISISKRWNCCGTFTTGAAAGRQVVNQSVDLAVGRGDFALQVLSFRW
jgi:hypothetical protein